MADHEVESDYTTAACGSQDFTRVRGQRDRCVEDYVYVNGEHGGTFKFCETCPQATTLKEA